MKKQLKTRGDRVVNLEVLETDDGLTVRAGRHHDFVKIWVDSEGVPRVAVVDVDTGNVTSSPKEGSDILLLCWAR